MPETNKPAKPAKPEAPKPTVKKVTAGSFKATRIPIADTLQGVTFVVGEPTKSKATNYVKAQIAAGFLVKC